MIQDFEDRSFNRHHLLPLSQIPRLLIGCLNSKYFNYQANVKSRLQKWPTVDQDSRYSERFTNLTYSIRSHWKSRIVTVQDRRRRPGPRSKTNHAGDNVQWHAI